MTLRRTSQTIAMSLRYYLYAVTPGSVYNTYPHGPSRPVPVEYSEHERAEHAVRLAEMLGEWRAVDPEGYELWEAAQATDSDPDPCRFCRECRGRVAAAPVTVRPWMREANSR
ncbi:hypothetical protein ACWC0C_07105 [Streptomyces sp. NPDC001709]